MNKPSTLASVVLMLAALTGSAFAQGSMGAGEIGWRDGTPAAGSAKTREQVRAELAQARRDGDLVAAGDADTASNTAQSGRYATAFAGVSKTRAEVKAELAEARRNGDVIVGDSSVTLREEFPQRYPQQRVAARTDVAQRGAAAASGAR